MAKKGRKLSATVAKQDIAAQLRLEQRFGALEKGIVEWLDGGGDYLFHSALDDLEDDLLPPPAPVRDSDPRAARIIGWTSRYLTAHHAAAEVRKFAQRIDSERDTAFAELVAAVAEPAPVAQHWLKFIKYLEAEGIGQADIQARMRSLAHHVAAEIRDFNDGATRRKVGPTPEYGISRWDELPREFAGFRLVDVDEAEPLAPEPCPLPPAILIDHFTIGRVTPPMGKNRRETYIIWGEIIKEWAKREGQNLCNKSPHVWAMLLAYDMDDDDSDVRFFEGLYLESPWDPGRLVQIEIFEGPVRYTEQVTSKYDE